MARAKRTRARVRQVEAMGSEERGKRSWRQRRYPRVHSLQKFLRAYGVGVEGAQGRQDFAQRLGTSVAYLVQLGLGYRQASMELAVKVERMSHGMVKAEELVPNADWEYLASRRRVAATTTTQA